MRTLQIIALSFVIVSTVKSDDAVSFDDDIAPILESSCIRCHNDGEREGGLSLASRASAVRGGESGRLFTPFNSQASLLFGYIAGDDPEMPKDGPSLSPEEIKQLRKWIDDGAAWPRDRQLIDRSLADRDWWSLKPLVRDALPAAREHSPLRSPIDAFIANRLGQRGLTFSPETDRRTLLRRLTFDLLGLPPAPGRVDRFVADPRPDAYERQVDRLLASPHYGERWARHWLDVVHYGDTHGYDKDKPRPNAWPYRDYVIRSFNSDKPYQRFVREQLAGDALWPETVAGIEATGFIAAGPWDFIGHAEVPESKIDGKVARHLDRDDMVRTVFETFCSTTIGCAQCHNHKFDPITMQDYYNLQSVFAAIDRAEREYDRDPEVATRRATWVAKLKRAEQERDALAARIQRISGPELVETTQQIAKLEQGKEATPKPRPEFGYHSSIEANSGVIKWVQIDLGASVPLERVVIVGCHDDFHNIGAGFGFPKRFRIEVSDDADFASGVVTIADHAAGDYDNPGVTPQSFSFARTSARYVRVTATKLANRLPTDYHLALGEVLVFGENGANIAAGKQVTSLDSIEAPVRWRRSNVTDGYYYGIWKNVDLKQLAALIARRDALFESLVPPPLRRSLTAAGKAVQNTRAQLASLPPKAKVYVGCVHAGSGNFVGRAGKGPREVRVLHRGQVTEPRNLAFPATLRMIEDVDARFELPPQHDESARRIALAEWIVHVDNPLTWRSVVNRIWQYHFGRAIVGSPGDFGRMGQLPTHPALLDWLAARFRDEGQSIKRFHRLLVSSRTYRQSSLARPAGARLDAGNRYLWRMNRRKLEAEALRDTTLLLAGRLDRRLGGPGFQDFVLEQPAHSPHYEYHKHDPLDARTHRRSVYRFLVRSQPQPFMETLDCADPSQMVDKRNETVTALQSLAMLNNPFVVAMSEQFARRIAAEHHELPRQVRAAFRAALGRAPSAAEQAELELYAQQFGLANMCRVILNMNEFAFVD